MGSPHIISAAFQVPARARDAIVRLRRAGWEASDIGILSRDEHGRRVYRGYDDIRPTRVRPLAAMGSITGAGGGVFIALGMLYGFVPVISPLIAMGYLATILVTSTGGGLIGGLLGAMLGHALHDEDAALFNNTVESPQTVIAVTVDDTDEAVHAMSLLDQARTTA